MYYNFFRPCTLLARQPPPLPTLLSSVSSLFLFAFFLSWFCFLLRCVFLSSTVMLCVVIVFVCCLFLFLHFFYGHREYRIESVRFGHRAEDGTRWEMMMRALLCTRMALLGRKNRRRDNERRKDNERDPQIYCSTFTMGF